MFEPPRGSAGRRRVQSGRCRGGLIAEGQQGMVCLDFSRRDAAARTFEQTAVVDACDQFDCFPGFLAFAPVDPLDLYKPLVVSARERCRNCCPCCPCCPCCRHTDRCAGKNHGTGFSGGACTNGRTGPQAGRHVHVHVQFREKIHLQTGQGAANTAKTPLTVTFV